ncbi:MAG: NTP transferase domain-containing protein, partial [Candidatus Binatia bacterium]
MRAIIYAAGVGSRLGRLAGDRPKILLELGGRTLLERHVDHLGAVGIRDVVVVTGYERKKVEDEIERLARGRPVRLIAVPNEAFCEGSAVSVAAAASWMTREAAPLVLMDGDVLYPAELLRKLVDSPHPTCLLIDRNCALDESDPVLVPIRGGRPYDFRKRYEGPYDSIGESVGFFKLGTADLDRWLEATRSRTVAAGRAETLEDIVREMVLEGRFQHEDVTGMPWIEIDFP